MFAARLRWSGPFVPQDSCCGGVEPVCRWFSTESRSTREEGGEGSGGFRSPRMFHRAKFGVKGTSSGWKSLANFVKDSHGFTLLACVKTCTFRVRNFAHA